MRTGALPIFAYSFAALLCDGAQDNMQGKTGYPYGGNAEQQGENCWGRIQQGRENVIRRHISGPFAKFQSIMPKKCDLPPIISRYTSQKYRGL